MYGGKRDVVTVVHIVGVRGQRDHIEVIGKGGVGIEAAEIFYRVNKFVYVFTLVYALVVVPRVRIEHTRVRDDLLDELVDG